MRSILAFQLKQIFNQNLIVFAGPDLAGWGLRPSSLGVTKWETVKAQRLKMQTSK